MDSSKYEYERKYYPGKKTADLVALIIFFVIQSGLLVNCYKLVPLVRTDEEQLNTEVRKLLPSKAFHISGYERLMPETRDQKLKQLRTYLVVTATCNYTQDKVSATDENEPLEATGDKVSQNAESTRDDGPLIVAVKPKDFLGKMPTQNETAVQMVNIEKYYLVVFKPIENQGTKKEMINKLKNSQEGKFVACLLDKIFDDKEKAKSWLTEYAKGHRNLLNLVFYNITHPKKELIPKLAKAFGISIATAGIIVGFWVGMIAAAPATGGGSIIIGVVVTCLILFLVAP